MRGAARPYRAGRARLREAEALLDAGAGREEAAGPLRAAAEALLDAGAGREEAAGPLRAAAAAARSIGAPGLLREVERLGRRARIDVGEAAAAGRLAGVIDDERVGALLTRSEG